MPQRRRTRTARRGQAVSSELELFGAVAELFHAVDPAVVLGYAPGTAVGAEKCHCGVFVRRTPFTGLPGARSDSEDGGVRQVPHSWGSLSKSMPPVSFQPEQKASPFKEDLPGERPQISVTTRGPGRKEDETAFVVLRFVPSSFGSELARLSGHRQGLGGVAPRPGSDLGFAWPGLSGDEVSRENESCVSNQASASAILGSFGGTSGHAETFFAWYVYILLRLLVCCVWNARNTVISMS